MPAAARSGAEVRIHLHSLAPRANRGRPARTAAAGGPARSVNSARFTLLAPAAPEFYPGWDAVADQNVATLRAEVGRNPTPRPCPT